MFRPIGNTALPAKMAMALTESQIEVMLFQSFQRNKRYTLVPEGLEPTGEGLFLIPQFKIGPYRLDCLVKAKGYVSGQKVWPPNKEALICIEADGEQFHTSPEDRDRDRKRDAYLLEQGIRTYRFTGSEIYRGADRIVQDIVEIADNEVFRG